MSFTEQLTNQTQTQNGSLAHKSTNSAVLDLFALGITSDDKASLLTPALAENYILALKVALYQRDVRQGQGNRDTLRELYKLLAANNAIKTMKLIIPHLPEIGRWKDVIELIGLNKKLDKKIFKLIAKNFQDDALLAKWLPRQGLVAKRIVTYLDITHGDYRRHIAALSKTVEQQICAKQWDKVDYLSVPSLANRKYANAFMLHDSIRREQFLEKAVTGEVKINSSVLYPHDIVNMIEYSGWSDDITPNPTADALWAQLPNYMESAKNVLPIIDLSSSMITEAVGTSGTCMDAAIGLGLYFAEHNTGSYKDVWMNFSNNPEAFKLQGNTLSERVANLNFSNWGGSTDLDKAMDFVLTAAIRDPYDTPEMILIISDMEFNGSIRQTNFERMKEKFTDASITMPIVVFWRLDTKTSAQPVTMSDTGAILLNGYSPSVLKYLLSGNITSYDPYIAMLEIIDPMYTWLEQKE